MTSNISSSSLRNITSLGLWTLGQYLSEHGDEQVFRRDNISLKTYLNKDIITGSVRLGSFSRNWTTQYASCGWYTDRDRTLWRGSRTWKWEMKQRKVMFKTPGASLPWVERSCAPPSRARQSRWWLNLRSPAAPPPRCVSLSRRWNCRRYCWSAFECRHADQETCLWEKQLRARFGPNFIQSELTIYSVKGCLQEIPLTWILRVKKSQKLRKIEIGKEH